MLAMRVAFVSLVPDLDSDAYGHFHIAAEVLRAPGSLTPHWVWLPGYHFLLAAWQSLGLTFQDVRLVNAVLQAAGPPLLYAYARQRHTRGVAVLAAACWSVCSLPNLLGTSALAEVPFSLLVLGAAIAIDASERSPWCSIAAGSLLALACTIRYEAWAASFALACVWTVAALRDRSPAWKRAPAFLLPASLVLGYVVLRRVTDGQWLWFVRETVRFTNMQRRLSPASPWIDALWLPVILPWTLFGPALALVPVGAAARQRGRVFARASAILPASIATVLLLLYARKEIIGMARYLTVLAPFACLHIARGAALVSRRFGAARVAVAAAALGSLLLATGWQVRVFARHALAHRAELAHLENWANGARPDRRSMLHVESSKTASAPVDLRVAHLRDGLLQ
jgi:hypothetical protein